MSNDRHFPLHVLVICRQMHHDDNHGLAQCLRNDPAVRSIGFATTREEARAMLDKHEINTIMIAPSSGRDSPATFIDDIRREFPKIVFVIFARPWVRENFLKEEPRFEHYFYLSHYDVIGDDKGNLFFGHDGGPNGDRPGLGPGSPCYNVLRQCEMWHEELFEYDVALSFSGSDRAQAESIATTLREAGVRVFYDDFEQSEMLGRDLYAFLYEIYSRRCRYCVLLISINYVRRMWTIHERAAAQERALHERGNTYILPIRLDDTKVPGLSGSIAYASFSSGVETIANLIKDKLWVRDPAAPKRHFGRDYF